MLKLNAAAFHTAVSALRYSQAAVKFQGDPRNPGAFLVNHEMGESQHTESIATVKELQSSLLILGAKVTALAVDELLQQMNTRPLTYQSFADAILEIDNSLRRELTTITVLVVESGKTKYYEPSKPMFGADVDAKFPSAAFEIDEAAKCIALARPTAAVFHLMRCCEIAIRAVARCLGLPDPIHGRDKNWGAILRKMRDEFDRRKTAGASGWPNNRDQLQFDQLYTSLDAVRNTWRNTTMHVEHKYTEDEAEHIFIAVRGFMTIAAFRMDEQGLPLA